MGSSRRREVGKLLRLRKFTILGPVSQADQHRPPISGSLPVNYKAPAFYDTTQPSRPRQPPRKGWPPKPHVEDEKDSLVREYGESYATALYDPPSKGLIDQLPILYDSKQSVSDSMKPDPTIPEPPCRKDDNGERRFVLVPKPNTHSPVEDGAAGRSKKLPAIPVVVPELDRKSVV